MTTMRPTFHVQLFPTSFPPTSYDIEAEKRSFHRRRSTRKLEAARGATPAFLDLHSNTSISISKSPSSPRTRAVRRKGQLFKCPSSPESPTEFGYLQQQHSSSSSSCSLSPAGVGKPVTHGNGNRGMSARMRAGHKGKTITETEHPQRLAQPFLLQLRSLPYMPLTPNNIKPNPAIVNNSKPLSPASNMYSTTTATTTMISPRPPHVLTADEKRRKLAKLSRTLGENIPPELVFHSSTTSPLQRTTSVLDSRTRSSRWKVSPRHKTTRSLLAMPSPKLSTPLSAVPSRPAAAPPLDDIPQFEPTEEFETRVEQLQTKTRPRSMTSLPSPTMATPSTRGVSLDCPKLPLCQEITVTVGRETSRDDLPRECSRRKGRDWSGEWNVKDMELVANALRGLKAR